MTVKRKAKNRAKAEKGRDGQRELRPFWSGTITFGLVSVPVEIYPANRPDPVHLRMLTEDGVPLRRRYYCPKHGRDVHPEHVVRGYEVAEDEYVVVHDEELEALEPRKSRDIDLMQFVHQDEIPPIFFERGYFLTPAGESNKAYRLLAAILEESQQVGVATFVMRGKEYLVAILAEGGILRAETMRFSDDLRTPEDAGLPESGGADKHQIARVEKFIQQRTFDALPVEEMRDVATERIRKLVETKQRQHRDIVVAPEAPEDELGPEEGEADLLETIRRSLGLHNGHARRNGNARHNGSARRRRAGGESRTKSTVRRSRPDPSAKPHRRTASNGSHKTHSRSKRG